MYLHPPLVPLVHMYTCMNKHIYMHAHTCTYTYHIHTGKTNTHAYKHSHIYTDIDIHAHIQTYVTGPGKTGLIHDPHIKFDMTVRV